MTTYWQDLLFETDFQGKKKSQCLFQLFCTALVKTGISQRGACNTKSYRLPQWLKNESISSFSFLVALDVFLHNLLWNLADQNVENNGPLDFIIRLLLGRNHTAAEKDCASQSFKNDHIRQKAADSEDWNMKDAVRRSVGEWVKGERWRDTEEVVALKLHHSKSLWKNTLKSFVCFF